MFALRSFIVFLYFFQGGACFRNYAHSDTDVLFRHCVSTYHAKSNFEALIGFVWSFGIWFGDRCRGKCRSEGDRMRERLEARVRFGNVWIERCIENNAHNVCLPSFNWFGTFCCFFSELTTSPQNLFFALALNPLIIVATYSRASILKYHPNTNANINTILNNAHCSPNPSIPSLQCTFNIKNHKLSFCVSHQ